MIMLCFHRKTAEGTAILLLYVDDMIIVDDDLEGIHALNISHAQRFEMKTWYYLYFLSLEITSSSDEYYLSKAKYILELLARAIVIDNKIVDTSIEMSH